MRHKSAIPVQLTNRMGHCWVLYTYCKMWGFPKLSSKASDNSVNCWTHCSSITVYKVRRKVICIFQFILVAENFVQCLSHQCSAAAQCGNRWPSVIGLHSLERDRTGHQSSVNNLQDFRVPCEAMKTLAAHCYSDVRCVPGAHSAGCRPYWVCLQHHANIKYCYNMWHKVSTYRH